MASTNLFELVISLMEMPINTTNNKSTKGINDMAEVYASLIAKDKKTIDDVPVIIRQQVETILKSL